MWPGSSRIDHARAIKSGYETILLASDKSTVVFISPLIALMKEQVWAITERGISAIYTGETGV